MSARKRARFIWIPVLWPLLAGIALLAGARYLRHIPEYGELGFELTRDIGIAIIVSSIVAALFEIYRSERHELEGTRDVVRAIMNEKMSPDVWLELDGLISTKQMIRRDLRIRLELQRHPDLQPHEAVLRVEITYQIHGLTSKKSKIDIEHELDYHLGNPHLRLPRFERIVILRPKKKACDWDAARISKNLTDGRKFHYTCDIPPRDTGYVDVHIDRYELVHAPGSYNLYLPEFTKGISLSVAGWPQEISVEVLLRPRGDALRQVGNSWSCPDLMLPGQGLEIKFLDTRAGVSAA